MLCPSGANRCRTGDQRSGRRRTDQAAGRSSTIQAATVAEAIDRLDEQTPGLRNRIVDSGPVIRQHINVFVDGERAALGTPLGANSTIHVIPAVSGG